MAKHKLWIDTLNYAPLIQVFFTQTIVSPYIYEDIPKSPLKLSPNYKITSEMERTDAKPMGDPQIAKLSFS